MKVKEIYAKDKNQAIGLFEKLAQGHVQNIYSKTQKKKFKD